MGESAEDLVAYAMAQGAEGYDVHEVRICTCAACGGQVFGVHGDLEERAVQRICRGCGTEHFIADSGAYWHAMKPAIMVCDGDGDEEDFKRRRGLFLVRRQRRHSCDSAHQPVCGLRAARLLGRLDGPHRRHDPARARVVRPTPA